MSPEEAVMLWAASQARWEVADAKGKVPTFLKPTVGHRLVGILHLTLFNPPTALQEWYNIQF